MKSTWAFTLCLGAATLVGCAADTSGSSNERIPLVRTTQLQGTDAAPEGAGCTVICTQDCPSKCYAVCDEEPGAVGGSDPGAGDDCVTETLCFDADGSICGPACVVEYILPSDCAVMVTVSPNGGKTETVCVESHGQTSGAGGQGSAGQATSTDELQAPSRAEAAPPPSDCEEPIACTRDAMICPDGSAVGRVGPNCEFAPCPGDDPVACTEEAKQCADGSWVGRQGPKCEFAPCPDEGVACTADAMLCPDGSFVGREGPNCEFRPCPGAR